MTPFLSRCLFVLVAVLALAASGRAEEKAPTAIRDEAKLFSPAATAEAEKQIAEIIGKYHHGIVVETIPSLPDADHKWYKFWWNRQRHNRMAQEARDRAEQAGLDGVLVLICLDPKAGEVVAWPAANERFFTSADAAGLRKKIAQRLREGKRDEVLREIVTEVRGAYHSSLADRQPARQTSDWALAGILGGGLGLWVLLALLRRRMGGGTEEARDLKPALLASRFGSPAGTWIYDRLFLAHRAAVPPAPPAPQPPAEPAAEVPVEEDNPVALQEGHRT
jgi:hypothetical protein